MSHTGLQIGLSPVIFGPFLGYRAKLFTRVILGPAQRNYIEKGTLPPKSAPQNKIGLKFLLQKVEIFRRLHDDLAQSTQEEAPPIEAPPLMAPLVEGAATSTASPAPAAVHPSDTTHAL